MGKRTVYTCDACGKEFETPKWGDSLPGMGILKFKQIVPSGGSVEETSEYTLGEFGKEIYLCDECTKKFDAALLSLGIENLYEDFEEYKIKNLME